MLMPEHDLFQSLLVFRVNPPCLGERLVRIEVIPNRLMIQSYQSDVNIRKLFLFRLLRLLLLDS